MDFKTDGKFIITSGGITQGIAKELNLGKNDCKKLGSIWNEIIKELNDPNNFKVANNKNKIPDKNNGFTVYKDAIVEFCKESWARIVNLVNTALNKNIEISDENKAEQPVNQPDNMSKAPTKKLPEIVSNPELDNWFLDAKNYVVGSPTSTEDITEIFEQQPKMITDWYDNYKKDYGEMNFPTAVKYLNDNPDLPEEIQEYIKTAFGICDGDITKNKQGSKGTCHLLSCKAELEACEQLQDIVDNIVVQNEDGTVTVTLFGAEDEDGNPFKVTLTNKEIRDSYKYDTWPKHTHSSSDPDAAALEIAYQKLISNLSKQYEELEQKENEIMNKQFIATVKNTLNKLNSIETTDENLLKIKEYLNNNAEVFNKDNPADILKKWEDDGILKDLYKCEILDPNCEEYNNLSIERSAIYKKLDTLSEKYSDCARDFTEENLAKTLGGLSEYTFQILTGKKAHRVLPCLSEEEMKIDTNNELYQKAVIESFDNFLQNTDITNTPIVLGFKENNKELGIITPHAYSLKSIYTDEKTGEKMVIVHNPHGYDVAPIPYEKFLQNLSNISYIDLNDK